MPELTWRRVRHALGAPLRVWKSSLTLRVVVSALLGSLVALTVAGAFLLYRVTDGIVYSAQDAALTSANEAMASIESAMQAAGYDYTSGDTLASIATAAIARGTTGAQYQMQFMTGVSDLMSPTLNPASIPTELRVAVAGDTTRAVLSQPTEVLYRNGLPSAPGFAVASTVGGAGGQRFVVFFVFSFAQQQQTLIVVRAAVALSGLVVFLGMGVVAYIVSRQTLKPLRVARRAAERLAAGELTQLMPVHGTDDLAQLAVSMNHMASQLQQRIRQMEQLSRVQRRFVSDVSHELRTPLTTVKMAADVLYDRRDGLPEVEAKSVELLYKEVNRFEVLLADLLEISRFDAGAAQLVLDEVDVTRLAQAELDGLRDVAASQGTDLRLVGGACVAQVDPRRVARLLRNLVANAIEHGERRPIDVTVAADDEVVAFTVRDHGVGFTVDQGRQLFNRFWRADPARARHIGGTGLGLAIAQEDVRLHQGWIHAWGRPGQGAQFRVVLPKRADVVVTHSPLPLIPRDAERAEVET